jgi:hypothetical protein
MPQGPRFRRCRRDAHQASEPGPLPQDVERQVRQNDRIQRHKGAAEAKALEQAGKDDWLHPHVRNGGICDGGRIITGHLQGSSVIRPYPRSTETRICIRDRARADIDGISSGADPHSVGQRSFHTIRSERTMATGGAAYDR